MAIDWKATLGDMAVEIGDQIFEASKTSAGNQWNDIEEINRAQLEYLSYYLGKLKVRELYGENVNNLVKHVEAQIANLQFVDESLRLKATVAFWEKAAEISMSVIYNIAKEMIVSGLKA